ncbi:hypothetical protein [Dyadobacter bucti]|uniref:hypothetical protein n=1 Tax=Dyadobacter bucti TaxID=2572203 RepID=UPI001109F964|nr:hypothetical protein [Dyadobacter bucti]
MDIHTQKIELAKRLLDTDDESIIDAVNASFKSHDQSNKWGDLPDKVISDLEESIRQVDAGKVVSNDIARETYKKWL